MIKLILRILKCVDKKSRLKFFNLQIITLILSILNIVSILLVVPFIKILSNESINFKNKFFNKLISIFDFIEHESLFLIITLILVVFYTLTVLLTYILNYLSVKWVQQIQYIFKSQLYSYYINKNWLYHSATSSTNLIAKINNDSDRLTNQLILPIIEFFTGFILLLFIFMTVFVVNYKVASLSFIFLSIFYIFFYFLFKKKLKRAGEDFTELYPLYYKTLSDGFSSIKDTILFNKKFYFTNSFSQILNRMKKNSIIQGFLPQVPKGIIEVFFFILLVSLMHILVKKFEYSYLEITSLMGFYLIVCLRTIPTLQKNYKNFSLIKANKSAFDRIENDLINAKIFNKDLNKDLDYDEIELKNQVKLEKINFNYPNSKTNGIFNVNLTIPFGFKIGIAGKTGSGKSTFIDVLLGFLKPESGQILIGDKILTNKNLKSWQSKISFVPQSFFISETSIKSNVAFGEEENQIDIGKVKFSLNIAELNEFQDDLEKIVGENGKKLSGGQRQRLGIARAIYKGSEIIILDEATSALDTITENRIIKNLYNYKKIKTVIVVSHRLDTLKNCNKLFFVENGNIHQLSNFDELLKKFYFEDKNDQ